MSNLHVRCVAKFSANSRVIGGIIKLVLAIDALSPSTEIVAAVVSRPWPSRTVARVVSAIEYAAIPEKIWQDAEGQIEPVKHAMLKRATERTGHVAEQLEQLGIKTEAVVKIDEPRFVILREAEEWPADLIFIRAHTYTNMTRWLLGSVSNLVLREAPCSVEIVRATKHSTEQAARNGLKILVGIDGSSFSLAAARSVAARPWPKGTIVKLLSVIEPVVHLDDLIREGQNEAETIRQVSTQAEAILSCSGLRTISEVVKGNGNPKSEIIGRAAAWEADLVIVGSHGRRGLKRWLLGSVSEAVARHVPCSVEVIRTAKADGEK